MTLELVWSKPHHEAMQPIEHSGGSSRTAIVVFALLGLALMLAAFVVANVSISGSSDSPCGSIVDDRADWVTDSSCGIAHRGQLVVVAGLGAAGVVAGLSAHRVGYRHNGERSFVGFLLGMWLLGVIGSAALVWRAATYEEPVLKRGWVAVRDLSFYATIGVGLACFAAVASVAVRNRPRSSSAPT